MKRVAFRIVLPSAMLAVLFYTLHRAEREDQTASKEDQKKIAELSQTTTKEGSVESIPFLLPFEHSSRIQDAVGFQWPAFGAAGFVAPVPQMHYSGRKAIPLTRVSYAALTLTVFAYWLVIGLWLDKRLIQRIPPSHSRSVRTVLKVLAVPLVLLFILFLGKDLLAGWPEGSQGVHGVTAWLAQASTTLLIELGLLPQQLHPEGRGHS